MITRRVITVMPSAPLLHLMQLVSPALPVGAYAYSQGLEFAVERHWVRDINSAEDWIGSVLEYSLGGLDLPILLRLHQAFAAARLDEALYWNELLQAARESHELLLEDLQMGEALQRLMLSLELRTAAAWPAEKAPSFATAFAMAARDWGIGDTECLQGFAWSWLENQVAAAVKLVPLGQTDGQRLLMRLMAKIDDTVASARQRDDSVLGVGLPRLAMASAQHETQYSRLFRS